MKDRQTSIIRHFVTGSLTVFVWGPATLMALFALWGVIDVALNAGERSWQISVAWGGIALAGLFGYVAVCHQCWRRPALPRTVSLFGLGAGALSMTLVLRELWLRQPEVFLYNPQWVNLFLFGAPLLGCVVLLLRAVFTTADDV